MGSENNCRIPELWGGIECTINRVGAEYKDQLDYSGHYKRRGDIEAFASLGIKVLRYPVLWEKHQPAKNTGIDWRWSDQQLNSIRSSGIKPIAGLLHHGSGPSFTSLYDPEFPYLFAAYAYEVANRYPWIGYYTPVNEPLTTARFSGLYGLWYPHHRNETSFYKMLLNQLKGTVLAMEAIRSVNPSAHLIQTEDLGKTHSTPLLSYQAAFENGRRLLTFDILTGRLVPGHPHYDYLLGCGITNEELQFFQHHPCEPAILGLNYYITSERWLDEDVGKYHHHTHGGNGRHTYADTEVVRANNPARAGFKNLAAEVWHRYRIPLAVTEVHLHCTREEQLRWFKEIWDDAIGLAKKGVKIKGVTAWALLGSFDWDTLLTKTGTQYESGVFDIKTIEGKLRPTAIASLLKNLIEERQDLHPVLSASGWWHGCQQMNGSSQCLVILNGKDEKNMDEINFTKISAMFAVACNERRIQHIITSNVDETEIEELNPWAVISLGNNNPKFDSLRSRMRFQYATFSRESTERSCLKIVVERMPTIHQINRVLDLMIDGDEGCWIFSSDKTTFKTGNMSGVRPIA
jgi:dTDP-4-dehydrorhamnose reductase